MSPPAIADNLAMGADASDVKRTPPASAQGLRAGPWARFAGRHLHDYNADARRRWLLLALAGGLGFVAAVWQVANAPFGDLLQMLVGIAFVATAAYFPVHVPRTRYLISVADVFVFSLLALLGPAPAVLAATAEGLVGVWRNSRRVSSRISTPAAAALSMSIAGWAHQLITRTLISSTAMAPELATLAGLCAVALPYFAGTTLPLLAVVAAKTGQRLSLSDWGRDYAWLGALYFGSATLAGVLVMNARQFGLGVLLLATAAAATVVALLHVSIRRHEAEHQAQEARIADAEREAELNQARFMSAFTHAAIGMAIVRPDGAIHQVNQALCCLLGCSEQALLGKPFLSLLHDADAQLFRRKFSAADDGSGEPFSMELRCLASGGRETWVSMHCSRFIDPASEGNGWIYQLHDITSRRLAEDELHHIAYHDSLTDLANRNCFNERLTMAVERSRLEMDRSFAVMFLDLDRFKVVNDSLGHIAGNLLLREVASRLVSQVRPGDLVARLGGDEFAVLLGSVDSADGTLALAQRLLAELSRPMTIHGTEVVPGASIGITLSDLGYRSADEMLRDADLAMYAAKAGGRQRATLFDATMHERIAERLRLEGDLRRAIGDGQLTVEYQPIFALEPYRLVGFEALARWTHPQRGPISPTVFIALAEESGHIEALTAWVIEQAVDRLAQWSRTLAGGDALSMHVNVCGRDLADPGLAPHVCAVLERHGLPARQLTLEITETTLMSKLDLSLGTLQALRRTGVKFSIDDFGTGYSSLAYLSTLPIDSLKIDRSFVLGMDHQPQNVEIVRAVLDLGRSLGKNVIAEGIETPEQLATLRELGIPQGQGYLLSRPLRADRASDLLHELATAAA